MYILGLATGSSPTGLYKHLAGEANAGEFDPSKIESFNLDEYVGLPGENAQQRALHPESYSYFMIQEFSVTCRTSSVRLTSLGDPYRPGQTCIRTPGKSERLGGTRVG